MNSRDPYKMVVEFTNYSQIVSSVSYRAVGKGKKRAHFLSVRPKAPGDVINTVIPLWQASLLHITFMFFLTGYAYTYMLSQHSCIIVALQCISAIEGVLPLLKSR